MTAATALRALLALLTLGAGGVAVGVTVAGPSAPPATAEVITAAPVEGAARIDGDSLAGAIVAKNPFRAHRSPAHLRYSAATVAGVPTPSTPTVQFALAGVLLGDEPVALLDGLPGFEHTRAVRVGETVAGYRLREVSADRAVVVGPDTTYVLPVRTRTP